jgi:hypothetical protein
MARRRESGCPVHITLWSRLELLDEWPYYRPRLGRLATCHDSFRRGRRLTQTTSFPCREQKSKRRSFNRWHSTNCKTKTKPSVDQPNPSKPNQTLTHVSKRSKHTPGLAINSNEGTRRFFLSWHRGTVASTREWTGFLLCLMHLDANSVKHLGRKKRLFHQPMS